MNAAERPVLARRALSMADLAPMKTTHRLQAVEYDGAAVILHWDDRRRSRCCALWLRDNCACPECRHPQALERMFTFLDHPAPHITSAVLGPDEVLQVAFRAGDEVHLSNFTKGWLRTHDYAELNKPDPLLPQLWDASIGPRLPCVMYEEYMETDAALQTWIEALKVHGIVLLRGVPQESGKLLQVARRIGPVRASNFGEYYDVVSMPKPNASAYTDLGLELHTDLVNWRSPPDVQMLCCLKSSVVGGESVFADGFRVAEELRTIDREAFNLLSEQPLEFRFQDEQCDIRTRAPIIEVDHGGRLLRIRFNNWLRGALIAPDNVVEPWYSALANFWRLLREPQYRLNLKLEPGDLITYNNSRVLHGRARFDARLGDRHLQGCYLNQEDLNSTRLLLDRPRA